MFRSFRWLVVSTVLCAVLFAGGCTPPQQQAEVEAEEAQQLLRIEQKLDDLQAANLSLAEQLEQNKASLSALEESELKPVRTTIIPAEEISLKERMEQLSNTPKVVTKKTPAKKKAKQKMTYAQRAKIHVKAPGVTPQQVQQALKKAGFDPGPVDGKVGPKTVQMIKAFQRESRLKVDGIVGPQTWTKLGVFLEDPGAATTTFGLHGDTSGFTR